MAEPSESRLYKEFVTRSLSEVQRGLKLDSYDPSSKKRKVHFALEEAARKKPNRTAAEKVIDGRFALGGDDASYLASGVATLWSTVGDVRDPNEDELGLAPASLYAPDAVNGIRKGLLAALERRNEEIRKEAPRSLPKLLKALQVLLEQIDASSSETPELKALLERGTVQTAEERTTLLTFLMRLRELLNPVQGDSLAQLILSKGRGQVTELIDRFDQDRAALVAEHERRCKQLVAGETLSRAILSARNVELRRLLGVCEDKLRRIERNRDRGPGPFTPSSASSNGSDASSEGSSPSNAYGILNAALDEDLLRLDAERDAEIASNTVANQALTGLENRDADNDEEIAANPVASDALAGLEQPPPQPNADARSSWGNLPTNAMRVVNQVAKVANQAVRGANQAARGVNWLGKAVGEAKTHTPGNTPSSSAPTTPRPSVPGSSSSPGLYDKQDDPDEFDLVRVAVREQVAFDDMKQRTQAVKEALELRVDTLEQELKVATAIAEADTRRVAQYVATQGAEQTNQLEALRAQVAGRLEVLTKLRAQLEENKKAHAQLAKRHEERLKALERGAADLSDAQKLLAAQAPGLVKELRAKVEAKAAEVKEMKEDPKTAAGDAQAKAAAAVELRQRSQELADLKGSVLALERAQDAMKDDLVRDAQKVMAEQIAKLRAEEAERAKAADMADVIDLPHELKRLEAERMAMQEAIAKLEKDAVDAGAVMAKLRKDLNRVDSNFAETTPRIDTNAENIVRMQAELERLREELKRCCERETTKHDEVAAAVAAAKKVASDAERKAMDLLEEIGKLKSDDANDDKSVGNLWEELGILRKAAAERDERLQAHEREHASLRDAKASASGNQAYDKRFDDIEKVLVNMNDRLNELAKNQKTLQGHMEFDNRYQSSDFMAHLLEFADKDDDSVVRQDLRNMYQTFRTMLDEPKHMNKAYVMDGSIAAYQDALLTAQAAWEHKERSGEQERKEAKVAAIEELASVAANQMRLIKDWFRDPNTNLDEYQNATREEYEDAMIRWMSDGFANKRRELDRELPDDNGEGQDYDAFVPFGASEDAWTVPYAVVRGLVGQRGPTEPACASQCPTDALLPYAAPSLDAFVRHALPVKRLLAHSPDPTEEDVAEALKGCAPHAHSASDVGEALALLQDDFAITGVAPASKLEPKRHGVEVPHQVRWLPQGPRAGTMCRVAVLEHAAARCTQVANQADVAPEVARTLRDAATSLKLQQLAPLYALNEAAAFDDAPHPLGTKAKLVTRPCAVVRGTLSFPVDAGIARAPEEGAKKRDDDLSKAMNELAVPTATMRNRLRRSGQASNVYVAPSPDALGFHPAPGASTGADAEGASAAATATPDQASEAVSPSDYGAAMWRRVINRAIVAAAAMPMQPATAPDVVASFLDTNKSDADGAGAVNPRTRRQGLWNEMLRHVAISQDRLWVFVRLMSGCIGGDVQEVITMADAATLKASKAIEDQRTQIAKRVSDMQAKIVETVVASMLKKSEMTMSIDNDSVAVIDAEARKQLQELSSGTSGRPFFEANVALKNLTERNDNPPRLQEVLNSLANVGLQMQSTLEQSLADPSAASASLVELSHPSNSYFVSMKADAVAAIRSAHERLNTEMGAVGGRRRLALWELVEGGCQVLTNRFAELCGFLLVQARTSTGVSAMYVSHNMIYTNASQARVALAKLVAAASAYVARVSPPALDVPDLQKERWRVIAAGERVTDISITATPRSLPREPLFAPISASGWTNVGGRWY